MGEGVRRIPPAADSISERGVHRRRRCVDRGGVSYEKAGGGAFNHFAAQWRGKDGEQDRKGHSIRSHHSVPLRFESSSDAHRSACCHVRCQVPVFVSVSPIQFTGRKRDCNEQNCGRPWWAHFEFTRINITPTVLPKK